MVITYPRNGLGKFCYVRVIYFCHHHRYTPTPTTVTAGYGAAGRPPAQHLQPATRRRGGVQSELLVFRCAFTFINFYFNNIKCEVLILFDPYFFGTYALHDFDSRVICVHKVPTQILTILQVYFLTSKGDLFCFKTWMHKKKSKIIYFNKLKNVAFFFVAIVSIHFGRS